MIIGHQRLRGALLSALVTVIGLLPLPAGIAAGQTPTAVQATLQQGLLTLEAVNAPVAEILLKIAATAGFPVTFYGNLNQLLSLSLSNVNLVEGIDLVAGNNSTIILQQSTDSTARAIKPSDSVIGLWVFGEGQGATVYQPQAGETAPPDPEHHILQELGHIDPASWGAAVRETYGLQEAAVIALLNRMLSQDNDPTARNQAITALAGIGSEAAVTAMTTALGDREPTVRRHVIQTLGQLGSDCTLQTLGQVLFNEKNPELRLQVVHIMATHGDHQAARAFLGAATHDPDTNIQRMARQLLQN